MSNRRLVLVFGVVMAGLVGLVFVSGLYGPARPGTAVASQEETTAASEDEAKRDFMFQITGYETENQGGQTLNMYFHYRYNKGITESDLPNYEDLRNDAIEFMDNVDASESPYWETLNQELCTQLKSDYPLQAISCQFQVFPNDTPGEPYEPGYHGSIHTIGDIEPLALPGSIGDEES